jgi:hypothetical protein
MNPVYALIEYQHEHPGKYGQIFMIMDPEMLDRVMKAFRTGTKFLGMTIINVGIYKDPEYYFKTLIPLFHGKEAEKE